MEKEEDFNLLGDDSEEISEEKVRDNFHEDLQNEKDEVIMLTELVDGGSSMGSISEARFQKALEQTIQNLFSDKIEKMVIQVIQEAVEREISRIKDLMAVETDNPKAL
ncbi:MAG: hypothetical protein AB1659_08050 [Thermodesulfobacteriota bacterium]